MSTVDTTLTSPISPFFSPTSATVETPSPRDLITKLRLLTHPEGGYYRETDRDSLRVPNPFRSGSNDGDSTRSASTTIYYLSLDAHKSDRAFPQEQSGRGRYVIIHADEKEGGGEARIETFVVGHDIHGGEKVQWLVEGGKYKASFLLPDEEGGSESEGLLISETVVPGFEFSDHDFMPPEALPDLVSEQEADELRWLLSHAGQMELATLHMD